MRTKTKGGRRNSSGYGLEEDVCVAADVTVSDDGSLIHDLEDLGAGVGLLSQSDCLSADTAVREHGSGPFLGVHSCFDAHTAVYSSIDAGVRVTGGITISDPDSYCGSAAASSHRVPAFVDSLGKGKRKIDDMFPLSFHASDETDTSVSAQLHDIDGAAGTSNSQCTLRRIAAAGTSSTDCTLSHMTPVHTDAGTCGVMPTVRPAADAVMQRDHQPCLPVPMPAPTAYGSGSRPPLCVVDTASVHVSVGTVQPAISVPSADVALPQVCRRPRRRATPETATRRAPAGSSIPARNVGGAPATYVSLGRCNRICRHCNALFWLEERVKQAGLRFPEYHRCCMAGRVVLRPQPDYPLYLKQLFTLPHFMDNIRAYNSMFAMTSLGAQIDNSINRGHGPYVFKVSGQIYHWIGGLCPPDDSDPRFLQLYIFDTENEVENRLQNFDTGGRTLNPQIVETLIHLLDDHNELVRIFRTARDLIAAENVPEFKIRLFAVAGSKQHELPTGDSIGAIVYESGPDSGTEFDVVIHRRAGDPERVSKLHPSYMSLQFPLLFIYGEDGFHVGLRLWDVTTQSIDEDKKLSMKMYYAYQLHDRFQEYSLLTRGGRLFQQYVVTAYCSVEAYRLDFIRKHQDDIRNDYLAGLYDAIARGDRSGSQVGMRTILPASFVGGPRYMYSHYLDALAICRVHGNPSFFITFTCNVKWPEILDFMEHFHDVSIADRPDAVDRVFEQKIHQLITYVRDFRPFGPVAAVLYTVEFQKRGLPHCHLLLWIEQHSRIQTNADIDRYVSAELPDRDSDPEGYRIVTELMMHGPCGMANMSAVCMKGGDACSKGFPKPYCNATSVDKKGYVHYRRRFAAAVTVRQNVQLDNGYVVPYNMSLLRRFYAHINVEYCEWTMLIKYLFKYISKGTDRIVTQITRSLGDVPSTSRAPAVTVDEIKNYLDARYIGPHEACWRIFGFDIHYRDPPVQMLAVHLENMQRVIFRTSETLESVVENPSNKKTTLTQWLHFNAHSTLGRHLTYLQFPSEFVWNSTPKYWSPRCNLNRPSIGRLAYIHPSAGDLFYQRLLLCHQKGCTSFPGIRTVDDYVYPTNRAACEAMGLLAGDGEWSLAMVEAALLASAAELRQLFSHILIFCDVANPLSLWNNHWRLMSDDVPRMLSAVLHMPEVHLNDEELQGGILYELEGILSFYGKSVTDFGLRLPPPNLMAILSNRTVMEERNHDPEIMSRERDSLLPNLNAEQRTLFDTVTDAVANNRQALIFVYGHGGTGKTYVWKSIIYALRAQRKIVLAVASSGIASLLLPSGRTAHSRFKLPLDLTNESMCTIKKHTQLADLLIQTDIIIWDEAPMSERRCFEALDRTLRDLLDAPFDVFGRKSVILGGDFRQTLPVKKKATKEQIISSCITQSYLWKYFKVHTLTENMRLNRPSASPRQNQDIRMFSQWLLDVGNGVVGQPDETDPENTSWIHIPDVYRLSDTENGKQELIHFIYDDRILQAPTAEALQERAIICPKNETADLINAEVLKMLSGVAHTYVSNDEAVPRNNDGGATELLYPTEYLNTLSFSGIPPHNLQLKIGAPVMLLRNLNLVGGLCNGTRMIVTQMLAKVIEARIVTGTRMLQKVFLPRIMLFNREEQLPFIFKRKQFPIKVCYAMTINKSQGQSLNRIGIYLPEPIFGHGQLYVALSRATSPEGLRILATDQPNRPSNVTKNIVYRDFLENIIGVEPLLIFVGCLFVCNEMSTSRDLAAAAKSAGKKPMASVEVVGVGNIKPSDIGKAVRVKVYRKWTALSARGAKPAVLTFILLDQMGGAIQANVEPRERNRFENTLEIGSAYTITGFGLQDAKKWMQTLPNNFILMLGKLTDVQPFFEGHFSAHHFNFAPYDELPLRADRNDVILTDYIGCVLHVGDLRQPGVGNQRPVIWRDIILRNLEGNTVRFTLWNEKARDFDTDAYEKEPKPTVMAVSSCWVRTYGGLQLSATVATSYYLNPAIPETDYILSMYAELLTPPVIQNVRTQRYDDIEQEKLRNRTTVDELVREDPRNQTNVRFTVIATIAYVRAGRPWYFRRCTDCRHKIFEDRLHGHCKQPGPEEPKDYSYCFRMPIADETGTLILTCFSNEAHSLVTECNKVVSEQGHTDPYTLPPLLNELEGTTHLFQLHFASESTKENPVYILDTVMESGQHLLPAPPHEEAIEQPFMEPANEVVYLTGPGDETERVAEAAASADTGPITPLASNILPVSVEAATQATPEGPQAALPATPPSTEIFQVSDPVTIGTSSGVQEGTGKIQATKQPVRRQLLKSEPIDQACTIAKKSRQE